MRLVSTPRIADDAVVARAVWRCTNGKALQMLTAGARVSPGIRSAMERAGVDAVWIHDELSEGIEPAITVSDEAYERAVAELEALRAWIAGPRGDRLLDRARTRRLADAVAALIREVLNGPRLAAHTHLQPTTDAYEPARHGINVTILGLILGVAYTARQLPMPGIPIGAGQGAQDQLEKLGMGLALCDVGTALVPGALMHGTLSAGGEVKGPVRAHPLLGARLLPETEFPAVTRRTVAEHHERVDGRGYPERRAGERIHPFAQIAQMAATYDAMMAPGPIGVPTPRHIAWESVGNMGRDGAVTVQLSTLWRRTVAPYPEGISVLLSDGRRGIVAKTHPTHANRPTIRVTHEPGTGRVAPYDMDLADAPAVEVSDALVDVDDTPPRRGALLTG